MPGWFDKKTVVTRKDGSKEYYEGDKLVKETDSEGTHVIRVNLERRGSKNGGGVKSSSPTTKQDLKKFKRLEKEQKKNKNQSKVMNTRTSTPNVNVGVIDLEKGQTRQATEFERLVLKDVKAQKVSQSQETASQSQTFDQYAINNYKKKEKVYYKVTDEGKESLLSIKTDDVPKPPPNYSGGYVTEAPKTKWWDVPTHFSKFSSRFETASSKNYGNSKQIGYNALAFGSSFVVGATYPVFHPVKTVKGISHMIRHPVDSANQIGTELKTNTASTVGELFGGIVAGKIIGSGYGKSKQGYKNTFTDTNIKGKVSTYQETAIFEGEGIYQNKPIIERTITTDGGKTSTSKIQYDGKHYFIDQGLKTTNVKVLDKKFDFVNRYTTKTTKETGLSPDVFTKGTSRNILEKHNLNNPTSPTGSVSYSEVHKATAKGKIPKSAKFRRGSQEINLDLTANTRIHADIIKKQTIGIEKSMVADLEQGKVVLGDVRSFTHEISPTIVQFTKNPVIEKPHSSINIKTDGGIKKVSVYESRHAGGGNIDLIGEGTYSVFETYKPIGKKGLKYQDSVTKPLLEKPKVNTIKIQKPQPQTQTASFNLDRTLLNNPTTNTIIKPIVNFETKQSLPKQSFNLPAETFQQKPVVFEKQDFKKEIITSEISKIKEKHKAQTKINQGNKIKSITELASKSKTDTKTDTKTKSKSKATFKQINKQIIDTKTIQEKALIQETNPVQESINIYDQSITPRTTFKMVTPTIPIKGFGVIFPKVDLHNTKKDKIGFDVFARIKGKFQRVNQDALSKQHAINYGTFHVGNTSSASFKIVESSNPLGTFKGTGEISNFYKSKKESGVYIEKRGKRITSLGEKQEITMKGLFALKNKGGKKWYSKK